MDPISVQENYGLGPRPRSKLGETIKTASALVALASVFIPPRNAWAPWIAGTIAALLFIDPIRGWRWDLRFRLRRRQSRRQEAFELQVAAECVTRAIRLVKAHTDPGRSVYVNEIQALPSGVPEDRQPLACCARDFILRSCAQSQQLLPEAVTAENVVQIAPFVAEGVRGSFFGVHMLFAEAISNDQKREAAERIRSHSQDFRTQYNAVVNALAHSAPRFSHLLSLIGEHDLPPPPKVRGGERVNVTRA